LELYQGYAVEFHWAHTMLPRWIYDAHPNFTNVVNNRSQFSDVTYFYCNLGLVHCEWIVYFFFFFLLSIFILVSYFHIFYYSYLAFGMNFTQTWCKLVLYQVRWSGIACLCFTCGKTLLS
jgi:hypothetical protein